MNKKIDFSETEQDIVNSFLSGKSIRELCTIYRGYGRTKIKNLLIKYAEENPEFKVVIESQLVKNKNHREVEPNEFETSQTIDEINEARSKKSIRYKEFVELSEDEKKNLVYEKLNRNRENTDRNIYNSDFLDKRFECVKEYFLVTRNSEFEEGEQIFSESQFWRMLYNTPLILMYSLKNRIIPVMQSLDNNPSIGRNNVNIIIEENATVLLTSLFRTNLQIRILEDNGMLKMFLDKPRYFRISPEILYALIEFAKSRNETRERSIFVTKERLKLQHKTDFEKLKTRFDIKKDYGEDEYFNR